MSYLRALVRKTQAQRPLVAPRVSMPAASTDVTIEEIEDVVAAPRTAALPKPIEIAGGAVAPAQSPTPRDDGDRANRETNIPPNEPDAQAAHAAERLLVADAWVPSRHPVRRSSRVVSRRVTVTGDDIALPDETGAPPPADLDARLLVVPGKPQRREPAAAPPWRERAEARAHSPSAPRDRPVERPDVQISIGRVEVRAHVTAPAKPERPAPFRPRLTLQDYLARRSGER
jgi:hypothetical protein